MKAESIQMFRSMRRTMTEAKSLVRGALGIPDPWRDFRRFVSSIHPETWSRQDAICRWLDEQISEPNNEKLNEYLQSDNKIVREAHKLRNESLREFRNKCVYAKEVLRVLIYTHDYATTAAGYSLSRNLQQGLDFLGIPTALWNEGESIGPYLDRFRPTIVLANSVNDCIPGNRLISNNWSEVDEYRKKHSLKIGMVAGPYHEPSDTLLNRLHYSRELGVDFYYSFQAPDFITSHHQVYSQLGFPVLSLEFGANPLVYYPIPCERKDIDFVFLGSAHFEKWDRYHHYFRPIMAEYSGVVIGNGWRDSSHRFLSEDKHRYLYSRARIGLNLHVPFQIEAATEINERTYNLAACGIPQLIDSPKLLRDRFRPSSVYVGETPSQYYAEFNNMLSNYANCERVAISALEDVYAKHTIFHRADALVSQFESNELLG